MNALFENKISDFSKTMYVKKKLPIDSPKEKSHREPLSERKI